MSDLTGTHPDSPSGQPYSAPSQTQAGRRARVAAEAERRRLHDAGQTLTPAYSPCCERYGIGGHDSAEHAEHDPYAETPNSDFLDALEMDRVFGPGHVAGDPGADLPTTGEIREGMARLMADTDAAIERIKDWEDNPPTPTSGDGGGHEIRDDRGRPLVLHPLPDDPEGSRVAAEKHARRWLDDDDAVDLLLGLVDAGWRPPDEIVALASQARADGVEVGRRAEAEETYGDVYERFVRPVDPDLEGYGVLELVGMLAGVLSARIEDARADGEREAVKRIVGFLRRADGSLSTEEKVRAIEAAAEIREVSS